MDFSAKPAEVCIKNENKAEKYAFPTIQRTSQMQISKNVPSVKDYDEDEDTPPYEQGLPVRSQVIHNAPPTFDLPSVVLPTTDVNSRNDGPTPRRRRDTETLDPSELKHRIENAKKSLQDEFIPLIPPIEPSIRNEEPSVRRRTATGTVPQIHNTRPIPQTESFAHPKREVIPRTTRRRQEGQHSEYPRLNSDLTRELEILEQIEGIPSSAPPSVSARSERYQRGKSLSQPIPQIPQSRPTPPKTYSNQPSNSYEQNEVDFGEALRGLERKDGFADDNDIDKSIPLDTLGVPTSHKTKRVLDMIIKPPANYEG
jgi:hypothetical protein